MISKIHRVSATEYSFVRHRGDVYAQSMRAAKPQVARNFWRGVLLSNLPPLRAKVCAGERGIVAVHKPQYNLVHSLCEGRRKGSDDCSAKKTAHVLPAASFVATIDDEEWVIKADNVLHAELKGHRHPPGSEKCNRPRVSTREPTRGRVLAIRAREIAFVHACANVHERWYQSKRRNSIS